MVKGWTFYVATHRNWRKYSKKIAKNDIKTKHRHNYHQLPKIPWLYHAVAWHPCSVRCSNVQRLSQRRLPCPTRAQKRCNLNFCSYGYVMLFHAISCYVMLFHAVWFHFMPFRAMSFHFMLRHAISCYLIPFRAISRCFCMSSCFMPFHAISRYLYAMLCDATLFQCHAVVMLFHAISMSC